MFKPFFVPFFIRSINDYKMAIIKDIGNIKHFFQNMKDIIVKIRIKSRVLADKK